MYEQDPTLQNNPTPAPSSEIPRPSSFKSKILAPHHYSHKHFPWILTLIILVVIGSALFIYFRFFSTSKEENEIERQIEIGAQLLESSTNPSEEEKARVLKEFKDNPQNSSVEEDTVINFLNS